MGYAGPVSLWYNFPVEWFYTVLRGCIGIYVETVPVGAGAVFNVFIICSNAEIHLKLIL